MMWVSDSCSASLFTLSSHTAASQGPDQDGHGDHGGHHEHEGDKNYDDDYEKKPWPCTITRPTQQV